MFEAIGVVIGWVGLVSTAFGGIVLGVRALIRGPKEDKVLELDLQERVNKIIEGDIKRIEGRIVNAEKRAEEAESKAREAEQAQAKLSTRVEDLEHKLMQALETIDHLWPYAPKERVHVPAWIYRWLHRESKD